MVNSNLPDNMLTVSEVSRILHVHPNTLRRWAEKGIIKSYSISHRGDRMFVSRDIDHLLSKMTTENENE
jgi:excisionase family DNA binding protein